MARVHYVKAAQQRYAMVPVTGADGQPVITKVTRRDGSVRTTKSGREVTRRQTRVDKSQPLDPRHCERCGKAIEPGQPYKWVKPKSGPYGGAKRVRCDPCPTWQAWELSNSLDAQISRISSEARDAVAGIETEDDAREILSNAAEEIRDLSIEWQEKADNVESGFGHATYVSEELAEKAQALESWAADIEATDVPDLPEPVSQDCEECGGSGLVEVAEDDDEPCPECGGSGEVDGSEPDEVQMEDWRSGVEDALSVLDDVPL